MLKYINKFESVVKVANAVNVSYRTVLNQMQELEDKLNIHLINTSKGGVGGGGYTILTPEAKKILKKCKVINAVLELHKGLNEIKSVVTNIDKDQNLMSVLIGDYTAVLPMKEGYEVDDDVLLLISYENILIMLESQLSSVRNIFKGTVTEMQIIDHIYRIKIKSGNVEIYSDITKIASDNLSLKLGKEVYIGFKSMTVALLKL
jgi:molybdate transport system regulatory protein